MGQHLLPGTGQQNINVEKLRAGDLDSFQLLYRMFYVDFYQFALVNLFDKEKAGNLVNHCFILCWYRSDEFSSFDYILGFLNYAVRNKCEEWNKGIKHRSEHQNQILEAICSGNFGELVNHENFPEIKNIAAIEPGPTREVFMRFYARKQSVSEIAMDLGLTPEYTKELLYLAFNILHLVIKKS